MNLLPTEANVPYERLRHIDEINADFPELDVVLVSEPAGAVAGRRAAISL